MAIIKTKQSIKSVASRSRGRPREFDREDALRKAMLFFWQNGYEATTLEDLRSELGLTQASIYAAFGGKEQLFREAIELYRRTSGANTARALEKEGTTARESIEAVLTEAATTFTAGKTPSGCLVVLGTMNCSCESRAVQDHLHQIRLLTPQAIETRIKQGQMEGDVPKRANAQVMAAFFTTVLHGLSIQARDGADQKILLKVVQMGMKAWDGVQ